MRTYLPGEVVRSKLRSQTGLLDLPGDTFGAQVRETLTESVKIARSKASIVERPVGTGFYIYTWSLQEDGDYEVVWDKNGGVLDYENTTIEEVRISSLDGPSDVELSVVAQRARTYLGETFDDMLKSDSYGSSFVQVATEAVKRRVFSQVVTGAAEEALDPLVVDYLGMLVALELVPAARQILSHMFQSVSEGDDPAQVVSYGDRLKAIGDTQSDLLVRTRAMESMIVPLLSAPRLRAGSDGPAIDEDDDMERITSDPRDYSDLALANGRPLPHRVVVQRVWT